MRVLGVIGVCMVLAALQADAAPSVEQQVTATAGFVGGSALTSAVRTIGGLAGLGSQED